MKENIRRLASWMVFIRKSKSLRGYGIHSPFVFRLVSETLMEARVSGLNPSVEKLRRQLLKDRSWLDLEDRGAGSVQPGARRRVCDRVRRASVPPRYGNLLTVLVREFKPARVIELGTGTGLSTAYLAGGWNNTTVHSVDASRAMLDLAGKNLAGLGISNVELLCGDFDQVLPGLLKRIKTPDLAFIDGNHRKEACLKYFRWMKEYAHPGTLLIFDDIHWSAEMEEAWEEIVRDEKVSVAIDLFRMGIVFFRENIMKQLFVIRF